MLKTERSISRFRLALQLALLLLLLSAWPTAAEQTAAIGRIIALRGEANAMTASGVRRTLQLKSEIAVGELIRTGQRCRLQIMFADNTIVSLGPASEFQVKDYAWNAENGQGKMTSRVNEGVFRVLGGSITKNAPQNFLTETPSATIGIRGSMYAGRLHDGELQVVFQGGKGIFVKNALGTVDISTPGFGTRLAGPEQAPVAPYKMTPAELGELDPLASSSPAGDALPSPPDQETTSAPEEGTIPSEAGDSSVANTEQLPPLASEESAPVEPAPLVSTVIDPLPTSDPPAQPTAGDIPTQTTAPAPAPAPSVDALFSGRFMAIQDDQDPLTNIADQTWLGSVDGETAGGVVSLQVTTASGSLTLNELNTAPYDPTQTYSSETKLTNQLRNLDLLGTPYQFTTADVGYDNPGEFTIFTLDDTFNGGLYAYRELGFAGTPTPAGDLPTSGIDQFKGPLLITLEGLADGSFESFSNSFWLFANWHSGKVVGVVMSPGPSPTGAQANGFFFGDLNGTGLSNSRFVGMDVVDFNATETSSGTGTGTGSGPGTMMLPLAIDGALDFAQFYGNQSQGIGLIASGTTIDVMSQVAQENWQFTAGGLRDPLSQTSLTGTASFKGFAVGVGEDMNQIDVNRRLYLSMTPSDFSLNLDRDAGTLSGTMNLFDQNDFSVALSNLEIGGTNGSAYISDHLIIAGLGGTAPAVVSPSSGPLKTHGNYLVSEDPTGPQMASYLSWGNWEIAYSEPGTGKDYHVHHPGTLWIAGEPTPDADFAALVTANFVGSYSGMAEGVMVPATGAFSKLPSGACNLTVDFGANMLTSGSINFPAGSVTPAYNLGIDPGTVFSSGFNLPISTPNSGTVNGAFFGPGATSVGGNFTAQAGTDQLIGIFGGDR